MQTVTLCPNMENMTLIAFVINFLGVRLSVSYLPAAQEKKTFGVPAMAI